MSTYTEKDLSRALRCCNPTGWDVEDVAQEFANIREECAKECEAEAELYDIDKPGYDACLELAQRIREMGK